VRSEKVTDDLVDRLLTEHPYARLDRPRKRKWTMSGGEKIRICDMADSHLLNAERLCRREAAKMRDNLPYPMFQGEMAQFYAERDYERFQDMTDEEVAYQEIGVYEDLLKEIARRGLTRLER
jgi:hypothetical protein